MIMDRNAIKYLINIRNINRLYLTAKISKLKTFLYGDLIHNSTVNRLILNATTEYLLSTGQFKCPLFN